MKYAIYHKVESFKDETSKTYCTETDDLERLIKEIHYILDEDVPGEIIKIKILKK